MTYEVTYPEQPKGDVKLRDRFGAVWSKGRNKFEGYWVYEADFRGWKELVTEFGPLVEHVEPPKVGTIKAHYRNTHENGFVTGRHFALWTGEKWIELHYDLETSELKMFQSRMYEQDLEANFTK